MEKYFIPETHRDLLYKLAKDISELFDRRGIKYFLDGGTLLGAVRHQGLIPFDDDVDFGLLPKEYKKVTTLQVFNEIVDLGYLLELHPHMTKVYVPNMWDTSTGRSIGTPTLDLFVYDEIKIRENGKVEKYIALFHECDRKRWPLARYKVKDYKPLKQYKFGDVMLTGPRNPLPYLDGLYPGWKTKAVIDLRSEENGVIKNGKVEFAL